MGNSTNSRLFHFTWTVNITQIVPMLSSLWTTNNAVLVYYFGIYPFLCAYIFSRS